MEVKTFACDICKIHKKESNHWFEGYLLGGKANSTGVQIHKWGSSPLTAEVTAPSPEQADAHLCGQECAAKFLSTYLFCNE